MGFDGSADAHGVEYDHPEQPVYGECAVWDRDNEYAGFTPMSFQASGLPSGASASFSPTTVDGVGDEHDDGDHIKRRRHGNILAGGDRHERIVGER